MALLSRVKGIIFDPKAEWATIEAEDSSTLDLYRKYILILAAIPPFASFLGAWLFGFAGVHGVQHPAFNAGLIRACAQYLLSLPLLYLVAFVLSSIAPHFDGESDDRKALALAAYSYTPAWVASIFGLVPGLRWLDILGLYGVYVFYLGMPRMLKCPKDNADVFTLAAMFLTLGMGALHAWLVRGIAPLTVY